VSPEHILISDIISSFYTLAVPGLILSMRAKINILIGIYLVPVIMNILAFGILGWNY
jgi:hypothetical protein